MKAKLTISKFLKVFLISGLYLSFFAVQLFFNFDLANTQKSLSRGFALYNSDGGNNSAHSFYQKSSVTSKANIRLNKRFVPKSFPVCIAPVIEIGMFYYMPDKLGHYYEQSLLSTIRLSALLRGPPAIA